MINHILTFSDVILYWDLTDCPCKNCKFYSYLDGALLSESDKTHVTFRGIGKKVAKVEIYTDADKQKLFYKNTFVMPEKPKFIDISKAPYYAKADGKTLNTNAIQSAIDDCGFGECVYIPEGIFLTGALTLHSNMQIFVDKNGTLQGSDRVEDYLPKIKSRFEGLEAECYSPLINIGNIDDRDAVVCENILFYGGGKILGGGTTLSDRIIALEKEHLREYMASLGDKIKTYENENTIPGRYRSKLINICCSKNIIMDNLEMGNAACWNIHMIYSSGITTCNCKIVSKDVWNGDGWNPDSSTDCTIFNCDFSTGDDCVAIKSGKNPEGNIINKPAKNIRVFDCRCDLGHGISLGSEMSGGISDVYVWDCDMRKADVGCSVKTTKKRGGYIKNIHFSKSKLARIRMRSVPFNNDGEGAPEIPVFSDFYFDDICITGVSHEWRQAELKMFDAINLIGFDEDQKIENINFNNITLDSEGFSDKQTISLSLLKNINFTNLNVK